jgi:PAS domain S-box-containing protein
MPFVMSRRIQRQIQKVCYMRQRLSSPALRIAGLYLISALAWSLLYHAVIEVLLSRIDSFLLDVSDDLAFALITTFFLCLLLVREERDRQKAASMRRQAAAEREQLLLALLDEQRELFRAVVNAAPVGLAVFPAQSDQPGRWGNAAFERFALDLLWWTDGDLPSLAALLEGINRRTDPQPELGMPGLSERASGWIQTRSGTDQETAGVNSSSWRWALIDLRPTADASHDTLLIVIDVSGWAEARRQMVELATAASRRSTELDAIIAAMSDGVLVFDTDGRLVRANPATVALMGFDPTSLSAVELAREVSLRQPDGRLLTADELLSSRARAGSAVRQERFALSNNKGQEHIVLAWSSPLAIDGIFTGTVTVLHDVTERERLVAHLSGEHARLVAVLQQMPVGVILSEALSGAMLLANEQVERILGHPFSPATTGLRQASVDEPVPPSSPDDLARELSERALRTGESVLARELRFARDDGTRAAILISAVPIRDTAGQIIDAVTMFQDVTEHRRAEEKLRASNAELQLLSTKLAASFQVLQRTDEELRLGNEKLVSAREIIEAERQRYQELFDFAPQGYLVTDPQGIIREANQAASALLHGNAGSLPGKSLSLFVSVQDSRAFDLLLSDLQNSALGVPDVGYSIELELQPLDVPSFPATLTIGATRDMTGRLQGVRWLVEDITERKQAEVALRQAHDELELRVQTRTAQLALANESLEQRVAERTHELSILLEVSRQVAATQKLKPLLELILNRLSAMIGCTVGAVFALDDGVLTLLSYTGPLYGNELRAERIPLSEAPGCRTVCLGREPVIVWDLHDDSPLKEIVRLSGGVSGQAWLGDSRSWLGAPMIIKDRVIGMLLLEHGETDHFTSRHAGLAMAMANQAAVAIENVRLYDEAQRTAALEERQRLARDLHDSVAQALYAIILNTMAAAEMLESETEPISTTLQHVLWQAQTALNETRALIFELRPELLQKEGLIAALQEHVASVQAGSRIEVVMSLCGEPDLPLVVKEALYRIVQQALQNVVEHAQASRAEIRLDCADRDIVLEVYDNGVGFDQSAVSPQSLGLTSIRERVTHLGGTMQIDSSPGTGTTIRLSIPPGRI